MRSRSDSIREDEELRLPRAPGLLRRFWARHPVVADVLIVLICLVLTLGGAVTIGVSPTAPLDAALPAPALQVLAVVSAVLVAIACLSLLWRRRAPLVPFVAAFALELIYLIGIRPGGSPIILVACYSLAVYRSSRAAWVGLAIGTGSVSAVAALLMVSGVISFQSGINTVLNVVVLGLIGTLVGVNIGERKRYLGAIIDRSRQLLIERDQQAQLAAAAERARIAREMHDIVSHSLTVIVALSEGAAATADPEQARKAATSAADTARGALTEMRSMLGVLRDEGSPVPLAPMEPTPPRETVSAAQQAGYPVTLTVSGSAEVAASVSHAIGRIVQEGVTNAMRHAPTATVIAVRLEYTPKTVTIEIVNDGVSGRVGTDGFGVRGLAERAAHVHGTIRSAPDGGGRWVLRAELPTSGTAADADPAPAAHPTSMEENR